jgi:hypothetical protein
LIKENNLGSGKDGTNLLKGEMDALEEVKPLRWSCP